MRFISEFILVDAEKSQLIKTFMFCCFFFLALNLFISNREIYICFKQTLHLYCNDHSNFHRGTNDARKIVEERY